MSITSINSSNAAASAATSASGAPISTDGTEDRFLKLLIAQMKNQDPLNPMDNAQVTSQMAQINTVQGISQLNATMQTMLTQFQGSQAISLTGHQVLIDGNSLTLASAGSGSGLSAKAGFVLASDADHVGVDIKDAQGNLVSHIDLGAQSAGPGTFDWNGALGSGSAAAGNYTFEVKAYNGAAAVSATPLRAARVEATAITSSGVRLSLQGMESRYYSDVRMVL